PGLKPVCIETRHECLRCRIVDLPQTHDEGTCACYNKCALQSVYTFTGFYFTQPGLTGAQDDKVRSFEVKVHRFVGSKNPVVVAAEFRLFFSFNCLACTGK